MIFVKTSLRPRFIYTWRENNKIINITLDDQQSNGPPAEECGGGVFGYSCALKLLSIYFFSSFNNDDDACEANKLLGKRSWKKNVSCVVRNKISVVRSMARAVEMASINII